MYLVSEHYNGILAGLILCKDGKVADGKYIGRHANKQLWWVRNYVNGKKEGMQSEWYDNGQLRVERNYVNGKCEGALTAWYDNMCQTHVELKPRVRLTKTQKRFRQYMKDQQKSQ